MTTTPTKKSKVEDQLILLQDTLVSEFRRLQRLAEVTQRENSARLQGNSSLLTPIAEDKNMILDQIVILEEQRRKVCGDLARVFGIHTAPPSVSAVLPYLDAARARQIRRICDGILALSEQQGDLALGAPPPAQA